jgi:hypothetical protein
MGTIRNEITTNEGGDKVKKFLDDEKILASLIAGGSVRKASQIAGVSISTVRNRLSDSEFRARYESEKAQIPQATVDELTACLSDAVSALVATLEDEKTPATVKVSAADSLLRHGLRYIEIGNLERRISALEGAQREEDDE